MAAPHCEPRWSIVLPFFNERDWIAPTITAVLAQPRGSVRLILVDNASTDGTERFCRELLAKAPDVPVDYVHESRPGPSFALRAGFARVTTPLVSFWNADTWYPADYLDRAERLLSAPGVVAAMAIGVTTPPHGAAAVAHRLRRRAASMVMRRQAHTGTYGQCFRTAALRAAGGPRSEHWPYVLDDHELMHRMLKLGQSRYRFGFWCLTSARRTDGAGVRWSLGERMLYHFTPFGRKDWLFYSFLARRFERRGMRNDRLRSRSWAAPDEA